jgi:hypothetical protein
MSAPAFPVIQALREALWRHGYRPMPVYSWDYRDPPPLPGKKPRKRAGKVPLGLGWEKRARQTPPECVTLASVVAQATNTGILADGLRAIDLDLDEQPLVALCHHLAFDMLGATILRTRDNSPRCLLVYRASDGEPPKRVITGASHSDVPGAAWACKIEVLGRGQQFVAYGRHPSGAELQWLAGGPADVALADLPAVSEAQVTAFLDAAAEVIDALPVKPEKPKRERTRDGKGQDGLPAGDTFFDRVNTGALADIEAWVEDVFPTAVHQETTGAYRITSAALGRNLEEDLSIHPDGVFDFGLERGMTPIGVVVTHHPEAPDPAEAAFWLCRRLGLDPGALGWVDPEEIAAATQAGAGEAALGSSTSTPPSPSLQEGDKEPLPNGAYLRPEDTNLPPLHPWITESRADAEFRLKHSIGSFRATAERVLVARQELRRRRADAIDAAMSEEGREGDLTAQEKAKITRRVMAEVAAKHGFPGNIIPRPSIQMESGSQGNGKTKLSLVETAKIKADLIGHKYAPTLERAAEDLREYRKVATEGSMPGMVVRGRTAIDPLAADGATMCRRPAVTERAAKLGISPRQTICPGCPLFNKCGTIRQEKTIAALGNRAIFFLNREYAHLPCPAPAPDFIIGDEIMTLPAVTFTSIEPAKFIGDLVPSRGRNLGEVMEARRILERLRPALTSPKPLAAIRDACIDKKQLQLLRRMLTDEEEPRLHGSMPDALIDKKLDEIDHPEQRHALAIVAAVLREIDMPRATLNAVRFSKSKRPDRPDLIKSAHLRRLNGIKNAAVLLLDGTGDLELNEALTRRKINHNVVRMERDADIYGTIGKRYSRQSVTGKNSKGEDIRPEAAKRLRDEIGTIVSHFESPLLTATKQAEEALVEGGHLPADTVTSHGGKTRSINKWETDRKTAIDVAPDSASIEDMELLAGAFCARDPIPIVSMAARPEPEDKWPDWPWPYRVTRLRRFTDGKLQIVHEDCHPDPRVDRIFRQITDANIVQNLDRVRPIYNHRVQVALNERVLDLTYTRVSRHREMVEGGSRIDRILKRTDGVLPMTPETLSALFPEAGSVSTARRAIRAWRKWGHGPNVTHIYPLAPFSYRVPGQPGRPSVVMVSPHHDDPKAAAEAVLGPVVAFAPILVQPPPQHPEAPLADATATAEAARKGGQRPRSHTGWVPPMPRQPGSGAAPPSIMMHGPPDG